MIHHFVENLENFNSEQLMANPQYVLRSALVKIGRLAGDREGVIDGMITNLVFDHNDVKNNDWAEKAKGIADELIARGEKEQAGLLMNLMRHMTEFGGYNPSDKASGDVGKFFEKFEGNFPSEGLLVFDYFVTRNLPEFVRLCEEKGIELRRVRVVVPEAILAAQLSGMSEEKRNEFDVAVGKLGKKNFVIKNVTHVGEIEWDGEKVAGWFSPRTHSIYPDIHGRTERATVKKLIGRLRGKLSKVVEGGVVSLNMTATDEFEEVKAVVASGRGDSQEAMKLTNTITKGMAQRIFALLEELGFEVESGGKFVPVGELAENFSEHEKDVAKMVVRRGSVPSMRQRFWTRMKHLFG